MSGWLGRAVHIIRHPQGGMKAGAPTIHGKNPCDTIMAWHSLSDRLDEPRACLPRRLAVLGRVAHRLKAPSWPFKAFPREHLPNPRGKTSRREMQNDGEVAEWLKAHAWKVCLRETVTRVRIPLSPPVVFLKNTSFQKFVAGLDRRVPKHASRDGPTAVRARTYAAPKPRTRHRRRHLLLSHQERGRHCLSIRR